MIYFEIYSVLGFAMSAIITMCVGLSLFYGFRNSEEPHYNNALIIAAISWLGITLVGSLPFFIIGVHNT